MKTFEYVNHPSEFETDLFREMVQEPPVNKTDFDTLFFYLAVFDKDANFTEAQYKELLDENFVHEVIVDAVLTKPSRFQHGFGTDDSDVIIDTWTFIAPAEGDGKPEMNVVTVIHVDSSSPTDADIH